MYAAIIRGLNTVVFLSDPPGEGPWEVQENVQLDLAANLEAYCVRPEGAEMSQRFLCASISDPNHYRLLSEIGNDPRRKFLPTGLHFGGVSSRDAWERFAKVLPGMLAIWEIPDDDPPCDESEMTQTIEGAR